MSLRERRAGKKSSRRGVATKKKDTSSDSGGEEEHELFYYAGDRVQLMKEVLKVLTSKKIKSLAPDSIKDLDIEEINTMLLEELLGISNKRLKKILDGQNADDESSSSEEEDKGDVISLDDVSDDDLLLVEDGPSEKNKKDPNNDKTKNSKKHRIKKEPKDKRVKEEPLASEKEKLLSVLELLELQARARAIRSQIALETDARPKETVPTTRADDGSDDDDAVVVEIVQSPKEIVISSSDDETNTKAKEQLDKDSDEKQMKNSNTSDETNKVVGADAASEIPLPVVEADDKVAHENGIAAPMGDAGNKTDSEDDVIRLDVVEIDGIDD